MTGLECLREELIKRGCTKSQADSKVVSVVLDIVSNSGDKYRQIYGAEQDLKRIQMETERAEEVYQMYRRQAADAITEREKIMKEMADSINNYMQQIEEIGNRIRQSSETPEGRDALRKAQMFVDSVSVETKYDNTAYIIGLAAILSGGECGAIDTLAKVNPKIPPRVKELHKWYNRT